jgi:hypothetical protein
LEKIENKLKGWQGKLLSLDGRVTLLNSVISVIPIYWMSIYRLPVHVRNVIDKLRKYFLLYGGHTVKKKYCLVSRKVICKSKRREELDLIDIDLMNILLLAKWLFGLKNASIESKWKTITQAKYRN